MFRIEAKHSHDFLVKVVTLHINFINLINEKF